MRMTGDHQEATLDTNILLKHVHAGEIGVEREEPSLGKGEDQNSNSCSPREKPAVALLFPLFPHCGRTEAGELPKLVRKKEGGKGGRGEVSSGNKTNNTETDRGRNQMLSFGLCM